MLATIGGWGGWQALEASTRWVLPLAAVVAVTVGFWLLVVAPRLELRRAEIKAQAEQLQRTEDALKRVEVQALAQREIDAEKVAAVDAAANRTRSSSIRSSRSGPFESVHADGPP